MTRWKEFPLRTPGEFWPGIATRNGRLMRRIGELQEGVNINIQPFDTMAKRKGFVRAFDERFSGVVCGLFAYTDNCGNEYVLVADQSGITIRSPSVLPSFVVADCYPFDNFSGNSFDPLDPLKWRNADRYQQNDDFMQLVASAPAVSATNLQETLDGVAQWFKNACSSSYQTQVTFAFDTAAAVAQRIALVIRQGELGGAVLAVIDWQDGVSYQVRLLLRTAQGIFQELGRSTLVVGTDAADGTLAVSYNSTTFVAEAILTPTAGTARVLTAQPIKAVVDANLGLTSGLGLFQTSAGAVPTDLQVAVIDGGPV